MTGTQEADRRTVMIHAALGLLETNGPEHVTTRKIAGLVGASTMAVYSEFGSLGGLVAGVVERGFADFDEELGQVQVTDAPIGDLWQLVRAYYGFAMRRPHLYRAMYSTADLAGYRRTGPELLQGSDAFMRFVDAMQRAIEGGLITEISCYDAALQLWTTGHGVMMLTLSGYLDAMPPPEIPLRESIFVMDLLGLGCSRTVIETAMDVR